MDDWGITLFIIGIVFVFTVGVGVTFFNNGRTSILDEMNQYGNVRINGKIYAVEEVISGDK